MLILVAVTVYAAFGENGLIARAREAADRWQQEQENEMALGNVVDEILGELGLGGRKIILREELIQTPSITVGGYISAIVDGVPIPTGFTHLASAGSVKNNGIVVQDGDGNEFVWVPATVSRVEVQITGDSSDVSQIMYFGDERELHEEFSTGGGIDLELGEGFPVYGNGTYTVYVEWEDGEKQVAFITPNKSTFKRDAFNYPNGFVLAGYDYYAISESYEYGNAEKVESIIHYGGFYIARYQGSYSGSKLASKKSTNIQYYTNYWMLPEGSLLYFSNESTAENLCDSMYGLSDSVVSHLPMGIEWDTTLAWIRDYCFAGDDVPLMIDSSTWGNFQNSEFEYGEGLTKLQGVQQIINTGASEYTKRNNIYDFAGNTCEWTSEAGQYGGVVMRGGRAEDDASEGSAATTRLSYARGNGYVRFPSSSLYKAMI